MRAAAAIADPTRRRILEMLRTGPRPAGAIAHEFAVSRPAVSRHLRVLREAGLVIVEAAGRERWYRLDSRPLVELDRWLAGFRPDWAQALDALETEVHRTRRDVRRGVTASGSPAAGTTPAPTGTDGSPRWRTS